MASCTEPALGRPCRRVFEYRALVTFGGAAPFELDERDEPPDDELALAGRLSRAGGSARVCSRFFEGPQVAMTGFHGSNPGAMRDGSYPRLSTGIQRDADRCGNRVSRRGRASSGVPSASSWMSSSPPRSDSGRDRVPGDRRRCRCRRSRTGSAACRDRRRPGRGPRVGVELERVGGREREAPRPPATSPASASSPSA